MESLEESLTHAREAVSALLTPSSRSTNIITAAKEANRILRDLERAVQYAQREAMGEGEAEKVLVLGRLQQVERAVKELKGTVKRVSVCVTACGCVVVCGRSQFCAAKRPASSTDTDMLTTCPSLSSTSLLTH